jgi:serine/threonine-protein phosphatase CPPED1
VEGPLIRKCTIIFVFFIVCLLPGSGQEQPFYFVMLTDVQMGMYTSDKDFVREASNFEFTVAAVNRLKPGFVIILGDLVNKAGDAEQIREFLRISRKIDPAVPVYYVPGNHDVGLEPTPETLAAYRENIGLDFYSFKAGPVYGIVLNSALIISPKKAEAEYEKQITWLKKELETAKESKASRIIVFQHHPYFISDAQEADQWANIPLERRQPILTLLQSYGVRHVFAGHIHKNSTAKAGDLEMTVTGPVAMPFGDDGSGMRLVEVTAMGVRHQYFEFGKLPDRLAIK